jgi:hypothetical protein
MVLIRHGESMANARAWRERILAEPLHNAQIIRLRHSRRTGWTVPGATEM